MFTIMTSFSMKADKVVSKDNSEIAEEYDGPEETWMTWEPNNDLRLLREDFQTTMLIGNDAVGTFV